MLDLKKKKFHFNILRIFVPKATLQMHFLKTFSKTLGTPFPDKKNEVRPIQGYSFLISLFAVSYYFVQKQKFLSLNPSRPNYIIFILSIGEKGVSF